jgi:hypothetical protein
MKNTSTIIFLISTALFFGSCSKPQNGAQGPAGPSYTGSISGHVFLYNQYGDLQPDSVTKGVRVLLYNSSNTTGIGTVGLIDSASVNPVTGVYSIGNVSTGLYTLAFRDTGYGQNLHENFQFLGSTQPLEIDSKLSQVPNFTFTVSDSVHFNAKANDTVVYIYGTVPVATLQNRDLVVFIGNTSSVSSTPGSYSAVLTTISIPGGQTAFTTNIPLNSFYQAGLNPGQMAYINVYAGAANYANSSEYENYATGQTTYNALGVSAVANPVKL